MSQTEISDKFFLSRPMVHTFAFALYPIVALFSQNIGQTYPELVVVSALLVLSTVALFLFLVMRLSRNPNLAALLTSWLVLFFFQYGSCSWLIQKVNIGGFIFMRNMHRIPLYTLLFVLLGLGLFKLYGRWAGLTRFLNVISLGLVSVALTSLGWNLFSNRGAYAPTLTASNQRAPSAVVDHESAPDIYYIIVDGYASEEVLRKYFTYDNSRFTDYLKSKGFYLPATPRCNYGMTVLSLGSSLNMAYLRTHNLHISENRVRTFAESNGYHYIGLSSMNPPLRRTGREGFAWRALLQNEFTLQLLRTTVADPVALRFNLYAYPVRENLLSCFALLKDIPDQPEKKFVYAHLLCPHPPYVFKADGACPAISFSEANLNVYRSPWDDKDGYVQQTQYLNTQLIELIEVLLKKSKSPPIIVLQSDHGPNLNLPDQSTDVDMRMHIMNAYYLPGTGRSALYDTITPVNSFRVIFNHYLNARLPVLEDRCFYSRFETPFQFSDVTTETAPVPLTP